MIQRIQSIYLLLACLSAIALVFSPLITYIKQDNTARPPVIERTELRAIGKYVSVPRSVQERYAKGADPNANPTFMQNREIYLPNIMMIGLLSIILIWAIFSFSNRRRQINLCWISLLLCISIISFSLYKIAPEQHLDGVIEHSWAIQPNTILFSALGIFIILALKAIQKDEKLVRSADRLR